MGRVDGRVGIRGSWGIAMAVAMEMVLMMKKRRRMMKRVAGEGRGGVRFGEGHGIFWHVVMWREPFLRKLLMSEGEGEEQEVLCTSPCESCRTCVLLSQRGRIGLRSLSER